MLTRRHALTFIAAAPVLLACENEPTPGDDLAAAARRQIGVTTRYDAAYRPISYPNGDIDRRIGACTDVVVRACRDAWGVDLQRLVQEDRVRAPSDYARIGMAQPNPSIDHRRVRCLEVFLEHRGARLWRAVKDERTGGAEFPEALEPGDLLTWRGVFTGGPHIAVVGNAGWWPTIIQNHGRGVREDWLGQMWLDGAEGHFRWRP